MWIKQYQQAGYQLEKIDVVQKYFDEVLIELDEVISVY